MRRVRYSRTFLDQLDFAIAMGEDRFGARVVDEKRERVLQRIERHIADKPRTGNLGETSGLYRYPISRTPFVVSCDFDAEEFLRQPLQRPRLVPRPTGQERRIIASRRAACAATNVAG